MSDVLTVRVGLDAGVLAEIEEIPARVLEAVETVEQLMDGIREGGDDANPLSGLIGALGGIGDVLGELPDLAEAIAPLSDLTGRLPAQPVADVQAMIARIGEVTAVLAPILDAVGRGGAEDAVRAALGRSIDLAGSIGAGGDDDLTAMTGELGRFLKLFGRMAEWGQRPPAVDEVVELLSNALVGVSPDLLAQPRARVAEVHAAFAGLVPDTADVQRLRSAGGEIEALWAGIEAQLDAGAPDWDALAATLATIEARTADLHGVADRVLAVSLSALDGFRPPDLAPLAAALDAIPTIRPAKLTPILDDFRRTLSAFAEGLETNIPDPDTLRENIAGVIAEFLGEIEQSGLGQLRSRLLALQRQLVGLIEALPLRDAAAEIERLIGEATRTVERFDLAGLRARALAPIAEGRAALAAQAEDAIGGAVTAVWDEVAAALQTIATEVGRLATLLQDASGALTGFIGEIDGALAQVEEAVSQITVVVDGFDLDEPTDAVVATLAELESTVAGIDVSAIPDAALAPLRAVAEAVAGIDVSAAISPQIDSALDQVDPTPVVSEIADGLSGVVAELRKLDPGAAVGALDGPVDAVLEKLAGFGPEGLSALLDQALEPAREAIARLDFAQILAPAIAAQRGVTEKIDGFLDPGALLEPLETAYQPILDAVAAIEPTQYLGVFAAEGDSMGQSLGGRSGPPGSLGQAGGLLRQELAASPVDIDDPLYGFRPGDLLVPLIDLHARLMQALGQVGGGVLDEAAVRLRDALNGGLAALDPAHVERRLDAAFEAIRGIADPAALVATLDSASTRQRTVSARLRLAAQAEAGPVRLRADAAVTLSAGLDPMAVLPERRWSTALDLACERARSRLDLAPLKRAHAAKARGLKAVMPGLLDGEGMDGNGLTAALAALDPAPLRIEMNALFDQFGSRLVGFQEAIFAAIDETGVAIEELFAPLTPARLLDLMRELHAGLTAQVEAIGPAALRAGITPLFDTLKAQLAALDLGRLAEDLNAERDALFDDLAGLLQGVLPDPEPFRQLQADLAGLKPSRILADVTVALADVTARLDSLNPARLFGVLIEFIARIRAQLPSVIRRIDEALDAVLRAIPTGGGSAGGASAGGSISVAA